MSVKCKVHQIKIYQFKKTVCKRVLDRDFCTCGSYIYFQVLNSLNRWLVFHYANIPYFIWTITFSLNADIFWIFYLNMQSWWVKKEKEMWSKSSVKMVPFNSVNIITRVLTVSEHIVYSVDSNKFNICFWLQNTVCLFYNSWKMQKAT